MGERWRWAGLSLSAELGKVGVERGPGPRWLTIPF